MYIVKSRDSLLTSSSGYTNYRGLLNLVIILLVLSNTRAALENVLKYGILVDPLSWFSFLAEGYKHKPALVIVCGLGVHILISLAVELLIARVDNDGRAPTSSLATTTSETSTTKSTKKSSTCHYHSPASPIHMLANCLLVLNLFACISLPPLAVHTHDTHPISTSAALMLVSIVFLKLVSFHMINFWCRDSRKPLQLQSRTTRSFLRTYQPPAVEFGLVPKPLPSSPSPSPSSTSTASSSGVSSVAASCDLRQRKQIKETGETNNNQCNSSSNNNNSNARNNKHERMHQDVDLTPALEALSKYPDNLSISNMCAFLVFPTLCYELEYARTERIRKRFLFKRVAELIILSQIDMALIQQWIVPTVSNSVIPFRQMNYSHMLERLLKLAIPNHVIWLIWFYLFFHSLLNIVAELARFADREFYRDWWNSESVQYFWSNWNIPVHKWCARHLYVPLMSLGLSRCQASAAVFFVSAFFHEYLVSVPLKMFRMWAFTGMLIQLPWARFVSSYFNSHFANVAVWVSLIIGQPLCILMYYHDYYVDSNLPSE